MRQLKAMAFPCDFTLHGPGGGGEAREGQGRHFKNLKGLLKIFLLKTF
jgi:hypothetical protein